MRRNRTTHTLVALVAASLAVAGLGGCRKDTAEGAPAPVSTPFSQQLHDELPASVRAARQLTILTSAGYAPVIFYGPDGRTLQGSEADIAAALGRVLGLTVTFVPAEFPTILDRLGRGQADLGMSGITDTAQRQKIVDFVDYFEAGTSVLVQRGNKHQITEIDRLCGHKVSVGEGTTQELLVARLQKSCGTKPISVTQAMTAADAMLELRSGDVEATLVDYPPAVHMANDPKSRAYFQLATETQHEPAPFGIAVSKARAGLAPVVQKALSQVHSSGEYRQILEHWNLSVGALPAIGLNTGS